MLGAGEHVLTLSMSALRPDMPPNPTENPFSAREREDREGILGPSEDVRAVVKPAVQIVTGLIKHGTSVLVQSKLIAGWAKGQGWA